MERKEAISKAILSGTIAVPCGLGFTLLISLIIPTTNLLWALIAVGFASFFAAFGGYLGAKAEDREKKPKRSDDCRT
mgnify:CR=1 FL=1